MYVVSEKSGSGQRPGVTPLRFSSEQTSGFFPVLKSIHVEEGRSVRAGDETVSPGGDDAVYAEAAAVQGLFQIGQTFRLINGDKRFQPAVVVHEAGAEEGPFERGGVHLPLFPCPGKRGENVRPHERQVAGDGENRVAAMLQGGRESAQRSRRTVLLIGDEKRSRLPKQRNLFGPAGHGRPFHSWYR